MCLWSLSLTRYLMNWKSLQSFWSPLKPDSHSAFLNCLCWHVCGRFSSRNFYIQHRKTWTHTQTWGRGTYFVHFLKGALRALNLLCEGLVWHNSLAWQGLPVHLSNGVMGHGALAYLRQYSVYDTFSNSATQGVHSEWQVFSCAQTHFACSLCRLAC